MKYLLWLTLVLPVGMTLAELPPLPTGLPPQTRLEPPVDMGSRMLRMAASPDGLLHVAHSLGVHSFDGRRWQAWASPNGLIVRVLAHDGEGTLYLGGEESFGFLRADVTGSLVYTDLAARAEALLAGESFDQIWEILVSADGVFFNANNHLFRYSLVDDSLELWRHDERFGAQALLDDRVVVQFRGLGLKVFDDGEFRLLPGAEAIADQSYHLLPLPEGGLLALQRDGRYLHWIDGRVETLSMPEGFPPASQFGAAILLADDILALGASAGQLFLLDRRGGRFDVFQMARDFIVDLAASPHGGLFVLSTSDIKHVSWPSPWLRVGDASGLVGSIRRVGTWQGHWLALSSSGVLLSTSTGNPRQPVGFVSTGWTDYEAWDWLPLGPDRALLADSYRLFEVRSDAVIALGADDTMPRVLGRASHDPGIVYVGSELGLLVLRDTPEGWQQVLRHDEPLGLVTSLQEIGAGDLLLATTYRGVHRARLDLQAGVVLEWQTLGPDHGLNHRPESNAELTRSPDLGIILSSREGFLRWNGERFDPADLGGLSELRQPDKQLLLKAGPDGEIWATSSRQLWRRPAHGSWLAEDVAQLDPGPINSINRVNDSILIGGTGTLLLFDRQRATAERVGPGLRLSAVQLRARDDSWVQPQPLDRRPLRFTMDDEFIQFDFALPEFRRPDLARTRYRLVGYADQFTEWGQSSRVSFSRLKPGPYRFEAEARSPGGVISRIEPFEFTIEPAWYRQRLLLALWALLGTLALIGLLAGLVRWRLRRALAEQQRLAGMVDRRTAELAAANRKLQSMAHVDGLTSIANRRRLEDYLEESWRQDTGELAVVILDVDHFKRYNDSFGHQAGDDALREVARVITACLRRSEDLVARYGGEEFVCVLPGTSLTSARQLAEQIRRDVEAGPLGISVSIGIASARPTEGGSLRELIEAADRNLYQAKQEGRNRVVG